MAYPKTVEAYKKKLKLAASIKTKYWNQFPYNCGYMHSDGAVSWDCSNLVKTLINGWEYSKRVGSYCSDFSRTGDCTEWGLLQQCTNISTDFSQMNYLALLYMDGHIGTYIGENVTINGKVYNVIECTAAWGGGVLYSYVTKTGARYNHKDGSRSNRSWTHHGKMTKWLTYAKSGWIKESGKWYFYVDGKKQTGWLKDNGKWYFLDKNGAMQTGWLKDDGAWYLLGKDGDMLTGWQKVKGYWYYLQKNGKMKTGWLKDGGNWYYLREGDSGRMMTGWQKVKDKWYFLAKDGIMQTGWVKSKNKWYYLNHSTGAMHTGWLVDEGKKYYLDKKTGAMFTGKHIIDGKEYIFGKDGVLNG